jgi:hypothetical protein
VPPSKAGSDTVAEMLFRVRRTPGGWVVEGGNGDGQRLDDPKRIGQITDKASALDLASGMAAAIRRTGGQARVIADEG